MIDRIRVRLTYANVAASVALFASLGTGGAYAASQLAANSVGTKQLKNGAVTKSKLAHGVAMSGPKGAVGAQGPVGTQGPAGPQGLSGASGQPGGLGSQGDVGATGPQGNTGPTGPTGLQGSPGTTGERGPSDAFEQTVSALTIPSSAMTNIASYSVPAGSYVVTATASVHNNSSTHNAPVNCLLNVGDGTNFTNFYSFGLQPFVSGNFSTTGTTSITKAASFGSPATITFSCQDNTGSSGDSIAVANARLVAVEISALHEQ
jgi:hypothetical protein